MYPLEFLFFKHLHLTSAARKIEFLSEQKTLSTMHTLSVFFSPNMSTMRHFCLIRYNITKSVDPHLISQILPFYVCRETQKKPT